MRKIVLFGERLFMKFPDHGYFRTRAAELNAEIVSTQGMDAEELATALASATVLLINGGKVSADMIEGMPKCELIATLSVGYDAVDVAAATKMGIPVSNCPVYCTEEVAEHSIALTLGVARKLHELIPQVRAGGWDFKPVRPIHSFKGRRFGVLGLGRIGRQSARRAQAFGMQVVAFDPYIGDDIFSLLGVERSYDLFPFLETLDYLSIHCPLNDETWHLIGGEALAHMRPHSVVVNTARGPIVDQKALEGALQRGEIGGAGIDVLEWEPPSGDEPLLHLANAIVTPHIAWYSEESHERNQRLAMDELIRVIEGKRPRYITNPEIFSRR